MRSQLRTASGQMAFGLIPVLLVLCFAIGAIGVDYSRAVLVRAQLQNACDSAALAGLQDMVGSSAAPTTAQQTQVQDDATALANANFANGKQVTAITFTSPVVIYNATSSSTVPIYSVQVTATTKVPNSLSILFKDFTTPVTASARAGLFQQSTLQLGTIAQVNFPLAVAIQVNTSQASDGQSGGTSAFQYLVKGNSFKLETDGSTANGSQNAAWIQLAQGGNSASPLSPSASAQTTATQWASQSNSGVVTNSDGTQWAYLCNGANNSSTNGNSGWTPWVTAQITANSGSFTPPGVLLTLPIISDPTGNSDKSSLNNAELQIVGIATFNFTATSKGPTTKLQGDASFKGTLVNALPLSSSTYSSFQSFFSQFTTNSTTSGTTTMRLY